MTSKDKKKIGQHSFDKRNHKLRTMIESSHADNTDRILAQKKKRAMAQFGALLLLAPAGRTYRVRLNNPNTEKNTLQGWLDVANAECETDASFVTNDDGFIVKTDGCVFIRL